MEQAIAAQGTRTLYRQMRNATAAAAIVTIYMVGTAWSFSDHFEIEAWLAVQLLSQFGREGLRRRFFSQPRADAELRRWAHLATLYMSIAGAIWGSTILLFAHPDEPITVALTLCGLYGISGGSVPGNAYNPPGLFAFVGTIFGAVLVRLLAIGDFDYAMLGLASAGFAGIMILFCRVQAGTVADSFRIRFENEALVEALAAEKAEADSARARAEQANLAKSQFLAAASHDLRQPLYALSLFSASLGELRLNADARRVVGDIQHNIGALEQLFEGLLDLSRFEAGAVSAKLAPVSVADLFGHLDRYFRPLAVERGLGLDFRCGDSWMLTDRALIEQILANLVSNALRYAERGRVLVAGRRRGDRIRLEVWDTGPGIAAGDQGRIFEAFVQLANPERDRKKGLGLGLAIATRSAELLGTKVRLCSRPGRGARFALEQPACAPADEDAATAEPKAPRRPGRLMVIDDDEAVRAAMRDLLGRWHREADVVADAEAALAAVADGVRFALVLADYRLPGAMNGLDLIVALLNRHPEPKPSAALITADLDPDLVREARSRGIPILHKPLRQVQLRALIDGLTVAPIAPTGQLSA